MLSIIVKGTEIWDEAQEQFVYEADYVLHLEHSLLAIRKWESKWKKAFLSGKDLTSEETIDYIRCMTLDENVPPDIYHRLSRQNIKEIDEYMADPMTASHVHTPKSDKRSKDVATAEMIYYWMISCGIPFECQEWHLNSLWSLIRVCSAKNAPPRKLGRKELLRQQAAINEANKKRFRTRG